jgi:hypothetical protein
MCVDVSHKRDVEHVDVSHKQCGATTWLGPRSVIV